MIMYPCQKRRRVIIRCSNGDKKEVFRCAHNGTETYQKDVNIDVCQRCTLRQPLMRQATCCVGRPKNPLYAHQPFYNWDEDIIYPYQDQTQPPSIPDGYERCDDNDWHFKSKWSECPYRRTMNKLSPKGELQINAYCIAAKKSVDFDFCKKCHNVLNIANTTKTIPEYPDTIQLLDNYWTAIKRWVAAGRPVRSNDEVKRIHTEFCSCCDWYDKDAQRCKGCGCKVKPKGIAMLNKIRMKTESCPQRFW